MAGAEEGGESHKSSDSSTPKTHRVEGGLIYVRPNFPIQSDIEIESIAKDEGWVT